MTPEAAAALFAFIERYGLPLVVIAVLGWAYLTGKLVTPGQVAQLKDQLGDAEKRYERERIDRIAAEQALSKSSAASVDIAEAVRDALTEMSKRDDYYDRLEVPRRGR